MRALLLLPLLAACTADLPPQGRTPYAPSAAMEAVLAEHQAMRAVPLETLSVARAREVPTLADAARAIPNVRGLPAPATVIPQVTDATASGAAGPLTARLYRPELARDTPLIVWFPGGTWATGSVDAADDAARQLSARTGWAVVAIATRRAPENPFPAAHDDALAAYQWARASARGWGADPTRIVLAGAGPGANLALSTALEARATGAAVPDHLLLVTPHVSTRLSGPAMAENAESRPLTRGTVDWSQGQLTTARAQLLDPRLDLLPRPDLAGLPPTTIVLAEIDPLRSQGEDLAAALQAQAVPVSIRTFPGTSHAFFGLGQTVPEAAAAEDYAAQTLKTSLTRTLPPVAAQQRARRRGR